jgi:tRNA dimethylallyltransferase
MNKLKPILLTGCTASGKSTLAKELATLTPSLIINADALQVYKCWEIISARPSQRDMKDFHHALYGHIDCHDNYDVAFWLHELKVQLDSAKERSLRPIIVGGTGLYYTLLTEGMSKIPSISAVTRDKSNELMQNDPKQLLFDLEQFDFQTFNTIDRTNFSRVQRAWEVLHETGKGITYWQTKVLPPILPISDIIPIILNVESMELSANIRNRFQKMIDLGVIDEVKEVFNKVTFSIENKASFRAIGVNEIRQFIDNQLDFKDLEEAIIIKTRQYAKRQRTWFRNKFVSWKSITPSSNQTLRELSQSIEINQ